MKLTFHTYKLLELSLFSLLGIMQLKSLSFGYKFDTRQFEVVAIP